MQTYADTMTLREARRLYFDANGFGDTGGYDDAWVDFKLGPLPMPFPNTKARVEAVRYHDLHHLLTGYGTDIVGEFEVAAWEIAAGCKTYGAAWALNLGGMAGGVVRSPRRVFDAFVRGRGERTTYGEDLDELLALSVGAARERFTRSARRATFADVVLFALATLVGLVVGLVLFVLVVPLVPFGLVAHAVRRRLVGEERVELLDRKAHGSRRSTRSGATTESRSSKRRARERTRGSRYRRVRRRQHRTLVENDGHQSVPRRGRTPHHG